MTAFVIVVTFMLGAGVSMRAISCPTDLCVALRRAQVAESHLVSRFQVWRAEDFSKLTVGNAFVWPPIIDEQYM